MEDTHLIGELDSVSILYSLLESYSCFTNSPILFETCNVLNGIEPAQQMDKHIDNSDKMSEFSSLH